MNLHIFKMKIYSFRFLFKYSMNTITKAVHPMFKGRTAYNYKSHIFRFAFMSKTFTKKRPNTSNFL